MEGVLLEAQLAPEFCGNQLAYPAHLNYSAAPGASLSTLTSTLSSMFLDLGSFTVELILFGASKLLRGLGAIHPAADGSAGERHARRRASENTLGDHRSYVAGRGVERGAIGWWMALWDDSKEV